ncbi:MAG: TonB-dependent receptor [Bacteroides sp.]|nr:TonB-dependent receptor [Bacteroides sp.]
MKKLFSHSLRLLAFTLCFCFTLLASAQSLKVSGTVIDENGDPLAGATIAVKQQPSIAMATNLDGEFTLTVPSPDVDLIVSYIGYTAQTVAVKGRTELTIKMNPDDTMLDEVVVVGYGVQKKVTLTGSVSSVGSKDLLKAPMQNVSNLLTGKVTGLTSIQSSGQPGSDGTSMYVRGGTAVANSSGTGFVLTGPLVLVDGVERSMDYVNPNDIESISVLKDAAAAIYGIKGAQGVILITTKKGEGKPVISYSGSITATHNTAFPELLNASEYMYYKNKAREMDGLAPLYTADFQQEVLANDPNSPFGTTDWADLLFRTGWTQQHNVSASGSSERTRYYTSVGIMDQSGTIKETDYKRYNVRANLDITLAKNLTFSTNLSGIRTKRHWPGSSFSAQGEINPVRQLLNTAPIIKPYFDGYDQAWMDGDAINVNPIAAVHNSGYMNQERYIFNSSWKLEYDFKDIWKPLDGLKISAFFAYDYNQTTDRNFTSSYQLRSFDRNTCEPKLMWAYGIGKDGGFNRSSSGGESWQFRPSVSYNHTFGKHSVGALFLYEASKYYSETMTAYAMGFIATDPVDISLGSDKVNAANPSGSHQHTGIVSYVGRLNYDYDNKYLVEFAFRRDGSYVFSPDKRWGFFPSASLGWVLSREDFMKDIQWIDHLKVRGSYGQTGDNTTRAFQYNALFSQWNNSWMLGGAPTSQFSYTNAYIYRNLTWATTYTYNLGIEMNTFQNKLNAEIDLFYKDTHDLLEQTSGAYPGSLGSYFPAYANSGRVDSRGFEIALTHTLAPTRDFNYRLRGTISYARNKVLKKKVSDNAPYYRQQLGKPLGAVYGFRTDGLFQSQAEIDAYPAAPSGETLLGDIKYVDINGDGIISADGDYVQIGYGRIPEFNFSLSADFNYRDFYLTMLWQGVTHCDYALQGVYDTGVTAATTYTSAFTTGNSPRYLIEDAWTPENTNAKYPRLSSVSRYNNAWVSDWWIVNGEYLRLKNMQIGYNLPEKVLAKTPFSRVNVYLAGTNLLTFSHFPYADPESPSVSNGYYPQQKTYSFGLNVTF